MLKNLDTLGNIPDEEDPFSTPPPEEEDAPLPPEHSVEERRYYHWQRQQQLLAYYKRELEEIWRTPEHYPLLVNAAYQARDHRFDIRDEVRRVLANQSPRQTNSLGLHKILSYF